jgi:AraC-like DNA-binding protein
MKDSSYEILIPETSILKDLVESIYFIEKEKAIKNYIVYPHTNCNLSLLMGVDLNINDYKVVINKTTARNYSSIIAKRTNCFLEVEYTDDCVYEVAINFKPIGICCFSNFIFSSEKNFYTITSFNNDVPNLFSKLTLCESKTEKLKLVEQFLMAKFNPIPNLVALLKAVKLLRDFENKFSIIDIAKSVNLNQKQLNRYFNKYIGCSPAHFRRIERFRRSINDYVNPEVKNNLTKLAYKFEYTDQAHLINEFKKLTNDTPKIFFKNLSVLGNGKILWKVK